jgi:hypothetical protein
MLWDLFSFILAATQKKNMDKVSSNRSVQERP